jgi:hypothetical protein
MIASHVLRTVSFALLVAVGGCAVDPQTASRVYALPGADFQATAVSNIDDKSDVGTVRSGAGTGETAGPSLRVRR